MAFDGIVIAGLVHELNETILGLKISKIAQPESDELLFTLKGSSGQYRLLLSASASLPFAYLTEENKSAPLTAPTFCMVLRKHIANGKITRIFQPGLERIIHFEIEHLNELGDLCKKELVIELMGKHSNIILCDEEHRIIDSIKHVSSMMSSVREVLPGRPYFIAATQEDKKNPLEAVPEAFCGTVQGKPVNVVKAIYGSYTGISPLLANEIAFRAGIDGDAPVASLSGEQLLHLANHFCWVMEEVKEKRFAPVIIRKDREPVEFYCMELKGYASYDTEHYDSVSRVLEVYYAEKNTYTRIRQKSVELRKVVSNALERNVRKYDLQQKQLKDSAKKDTFKLYGEMIQAYGYGLAEGAKELLAENYYDNNNVIKVPLDPTLSAMDNAKKYFDKYGKLKRTADALSELIRETKAEIDHLESIQNALDIARTSDDLVQIRQELAEYGFIKKNRSAKKEKVKSRPFHYRSTDGYDIYVGKNNYQNDELTFKFATGNDWWFHAKGMPGSHVIVKSNNEELPDRVFEEAGKLAGYYSKGRDSEKIEIDYLQKKNVKKPNGSAPGFVVYYTNFSLTVHPDIRDITLVED